MARRGHFKRRTIPNRDVAAIAVLGTAAAFALYLQGVQRLGGRADQLVCVHRAGQRGGDRVALAGRADCLDRLAGHRADSGHGSSRRTARPG